MPLHDFRKIEFGFSSAETESSEDPGLLLEGFVELQNAFHEAKSGRKFLFLGYKGTGKSAIAAAQGSKLSSDRILKLLEALFECSAVGNIIHKPGGTTYYTFNYRNRHSNFNKDEGIMLHRGLWKALNLV